MGPSFSFSLTSPGSPHWLSFLPAYLVPFQPFALAKGQTTGLLHLLFCQLGMLSHGSLHHLIFSLNLSSSTGALLNTSRNTLASLLLSDVQFAVGICVFVHQVASSSRMGAALFLSKHLPFDTAHRAQGPLARRQSRGMGAGG